LGAKQLNIFRIGCKTTPDFWIQWLIKKEINKALITALFTQEMTVTATKIDSDVNFHVESGQKFHNMGMACLDYNHLE
jgi:hypothetical protein